MNNKDDLKYSMFKNWLINIYLRKQNKQFFIFENKKDDYKLYIKFSKNYKNEIILCYIVESPGGASPHLYLKDIDINFLIINFINLIKENKDIKNGSKNEISGYLEKINRYFIDEIYEFMLNEYLKT